MVRDGKARTADTSVRLCGIQMKNPIIAASGTFGYGREFSEIYDINVLGSFSCKGTTAEPRFGNETPRIAEISQGLINSVGLQNPGVNAVIREEMPWIAEHFDGGIMANVCGFSIDEYCHVASEFAGNPATGWIELNISCPNVHKGGMAFGTDPKEAARVTGSVKKALEKKTAETGRKVPLIVKLSPNVTDITEIARACEAAGADGLTLINTIQGMRIDLKTGRPVLAAVMGGMSGPAVFPVALRMVWQVYEAVDIPLVGCGGVSRTEDIIEMMLAGATAVEVGSANLIDPVACSTMAEELPELMKKYGIDKLSEITGGAH